MNPSLSPNPRPSPAPMVPPANSSHIALTPPSCLEEWREHLPERVPHVTWAHLPSLAHWPSPLCNGLWLPPPRVPHLPPALPSPRFSCLQFPCAAGFSRPPTPTASPAPPAPAPLCIAPDHTDHTAAPPPPALIAQLFFYTFILSFFEKQGERESQAVSAPHLRT